MGINRVMVDGTVTETYEGEKAFSFTVRNEETFGENTYETFVKFLCFKKTMEQAKADIRKGQSVFVEGRLISKRKEGSSGVFYNLEAVAEKWIVFTKEAKKLNEPADKPLGRTTDDNGDNIPF